ncbi:MAG: hypothetical protein EAX96_07295 [Candidatus Lokiarchaeota archaeon]|nr:hypothetical protein [Candidatus Lokiarchaeota archaeon]
MSLKEKLQKAEEKIQDDTTKEKAKKQKEDAEKIAFEGFSRAGLRDLWEHPAFKTGLIFGVVFASIFFILLFLHFFKFI